MCKNLSSNLHYMWAYLDHSLSQVLRFIAPIISIFCEVKVNARVHIQIVALT
jgi:hypothetical protein